MAEPSKEELQAQIDALKQQLAQAQGVQSRGDRNVVGAVTNSTVMAGDHATYFGSVESLTIQSAIFQMPSEPGQVAPKELLWTYLNRVILDTGTLDLSGVDRRMLSDQQETRLELAAVYTALDTVRFVRDSFDREEWESLARRSRFDAAELPKHAQMNEEKRLSALAFASGEPYAALLGDPGGGKTTFANFLALCLAGELLGLEHANLARLGDEWTLGSLLPVRIVLRQLAVQLTTLPSEETLWTYITQRLGKALADFAPLLRRHLLEEGGLLILDGLDEVPEAHHQRERVKQAVQEFRYAFPKVRILLTSRTYAYQRQQWRLPDFEEAVLAPFEEERIDAFVERWYQHMAQVRGNMDAAEAQGRARLLKDAIRRNPHLRDLAPRPLLLTLMASLHAWRGGSLPEEREQLYDDSVELLLDIWERPKLMLDHNGEPVLQDESASEWLNCPQDRIKRALETLAYRVHAVQEGTQGTADIDEDSLVGALLKASSDPNLRPTRVVEYIRDRAGLLSNKGEGVYSFPHRTFQEYLAARHLTETNFPSLLVKLVKEDPERWREVLLLAGAKVARGTPFAAWSLVDHLCPHACDDGLAKSATDSAWWSALLAGQLLVDTGIHAKVEDDGPDALKLDRVRAWLAALVSSGHLPPVDRAAAGQALGWIGDPRPGVGVVDGLPDIAWCFVPDGWLSMGADDLTSREMPEHTLKLGGFYIAKYPVTVAQYSAFLTAKGYRAQRGETPSAYNSSPPNYPVVNISWHDATAFCGWLSEQTGKKIRLPSEAEWEKAAKGSRGNYRYPWGNEVPDENRCNFDSYIGAVVSPGLFPSGDSPYGCCDMSGNVDEWTRSTQDEYPYVPGSSLEEEDTVGERVLRGGAFYNDVFYVRCASRWWESPEFKSPDLGFRVMTADTPDVFSAT